MCPEGPGSRGLLVAEGRDSVSNAFPTPPRCSHRNLRKGPSGLADEINFEDFLTIMSYFRPIDTTMDEEQVQLCRKEKLRCGCRRAPPQCAPGRLCVPESCCAPKAGWVGSGSTSPGLGEVGPDFHTQRVAFAPPSPPRLLRGRLLVDTSQQLVVFWEQKEVSLTGKG